MPPGPVLPVPSSGPSAEALEKEIMILEAELQRAEAVLNAFEHTVRVQLGEQIRRIQELTVLYKAQKTAKKDKRREQKRRGKNFRETPGVIKQNERPADKEDLKGYDPDELRRLYREAIVQVHPDKFPGAGEVEGRHAAALTVHLNDIYERGDVEALRDFHEHILGGGPLQHKPYSAGALGNEGAIVPLLHRKKEQLTAALQAILQSQTYHMATAGTDMLQVIEDIRLQFEERIQQLVRRTRT